MAPRPPQRGNRSGTRHGRAGTGQTRAGGPACCQSGVPLHGGLTWLPAPGRPRPGGPARSLGQPRRGSGSCRPRRHGAPVGPEGEPGPQGWVSPGLCFSLPPTCVSVYSTGCVLFPKRTHGFLLKNTTRGKHWFIISLHGSICQIWTPSVPIKTLKHEYIKVVLLVKLSGKSHNLCSVLMLCFTGKKKKKGFKTQLQFTKMCRF